MIGHLGRRFRRETAQVAQENGRQGLALVNNFIDKPLQTILHKPSRNLNFMLNRHNLVETQGKDLKLTLGKSEVRSSFNTVRPTFKNNFPNLT